MLNKVNIQVSVPLAQQIHTALNEKKVVHIHNIGWLYTTEWGTLRNPQTGALIDPPTPSRFSFVSEGHDGDCKGDHSDFFSRQGVEIYNIDLPELSDAQEIGNEYVVGDTESSYVFSYSIFNNSPTDNNYTKIGNIKFSKSMREKMSNTKPFIIEDFDWEDLRNPSDSDNPRPRLSKLTLA